MGNSSDYPRIARDFVDGKPLDPKLVSKVRGSHPYHSGVRHNMTAAYGTMRMSYAPQGIGVVLWSYEHFALAVRMPDGRIIVNGDTTRSMQTNDQQRALRAAVQNRIDVRSCILSFSALDAAGIRDSQIQNIRIIHTTEDTTKKKLVRCTFKPKREGHTCRRTHVQHAGVRYHEVTEHFLGETLFRYEGRSFVSGMDRNDPLSKRKYFVARLPKNALVNTVDEALEALCPKALRGRADVLRQGEWFFVPEPKLRPKPEKVVTDLGLRRRVDPPTRRRWGSPPVETRYVDLKGVPIISNDSNVVQQELERFRANRASLIFDRMERHRATRMYLNGRVYVSGAVRDAEHAMTVLGDGKTWYRVVKNTADGAWAAVPTPEGGSGRVD